MSKENNKMQVDIENLFKQNVNDLLSIKELYRKLKEMEEKITQFKYIDNTLVKKLKKEYEKLNKIILDENVQVKLTNDIETINSQLGSKANLEPKHYYVGINQKFKTINQAIAQWKSDGKVKSIIHISKGEYNEIIALHEGNSYLSIIGENKHDVVIRTKTGYYKDTPVNIQGGEALLKNLTVIADHTNNSDYQYIGLETGNPSTDNIGGAYALHVDFPGEGKTVIEDCILISYQNSAVGMGTRSNQQVYFINCEIYSYTPSSFPTQATQNGAFLYHSASSNNAINQFVSLKDCKLFSENFKAFNYYDYSTNSNCIVDLEIINCNFGSNVIKTRESLVNITKNITGNITKNSFGNNVVKCNYKYNGEQPYGQMSLITQDNGQTITYNDCNSAIKTCFWNVPYNGLNLPQAGRQFDGMTICYMPTYLIQYAWDTTQAWQKWRRHCCNGVWSSWFMVYETRANINGVINDSFAIGSTGDCSSIANLNNATKTGYYLCDGSQSGANCPTTAWCGCETISFNTSFKVQYAWEIANGNKYKRIMNNGTWGNWSTKIIE